jgi:hypothetical protein
MQKSFTPLLILFLFISFFCFSQEKSNSVVINKQVEVVEYKYEYVLVELFSSLHSSLYYPVLIHGQISERQQFFEQGRNVRAGFDIGFSQGVKAGNWALTAGISFQRYTELFSYSEYLTRQLIVQNQDGSLQAITVAVGEPVSYSRNNWLDYLKIPIGVGFYPKYFKNRMAINLQFNYHYLLSSDYMSKYSITQPAGVVAYEDFNPSFLSLSGSILYQINFYKNLSVTFEPYFDWGLNNLIDQKDLSFGMNEIGIHTGISLVY